MKRSTLRRTLAGAILVVGLYGVVMAWARFSSGGEALFDLMKEAAPLVIGIAAALLANAYQKRAAFLGFLRDEWYNIVETKTHLMVFTRREPKTWDDAWAAWARISVAIDRMRILYRNVGETRRVVGRYPYEPLHDMRRSLENALGVDDPAKRSAAGEARDDATLREADWAAVERDVWRAFQALREVFLDELDLAEPDRPVLERGAARKKREGAPNRVRRAAGDA